VKKSGEYRRRLVRKSEYNSYLAGMRYFVTAIGTDSGKTLVSSILCEALSADYWKPVQSGMPRDTDEARRLISNQHTVLHPETYVLSRPVSPHESAKDDKRVIRLDAFAAPATNNTLIIEGAGGCLVPLNDTDFVIDLIPRLDAEAILVSNLYLGSINHTLLTIEALKARKIKIKGLIFNGEENKESERIILHHAQVRCLLRISKEEKINREVVAKYASVLKDQWYG
jgi:dethiobiotin synthetase